MVGEREGKLCAKDRERRKNINWLENADLKDVRGLRRTRQGNSCRHLVLYYPRWEVEELLLFYIFNCYRVTVPVCVCTWACGRANWKGRAWHCSRGFGKQEGSVGIWCCGTAGSQDRQYRVTTLWVCALQFPAPCLSCNTSPAVRPTSHLLL